MSKEEDYWGAKTINYCKTHMPEARVICDETNNPPSVKIKGELQIKVILEWPEIALTRLVDIPIDLNDVLKNKVWSRGEEG